MLKNNKYFIESEEIDVIEFYKKMRGLERIFMDDKEPQEMDEEGSTESQPENKIYNNNFIDPEADLKEEKDREKLTG